MMSLEVLHEEDSTFLGKTRSKKKSIVCLKVYFDIFSIPRLFFPGLAVEGSNRECQKNTIKKKHDSLFRNRPVLENIHTACQADYNPRTELAADQMGAGKAKTAILQYMKVKANKIKQFVLDNPSMST